LPGLHLADGGRDARDGKDVVVARVEARKERVRRLLARNLTLREIAEACGVSERTIKYDVAEIRKEAAEALSHSDVMTVAAAVLNRSEARHRELWGLFTKVDGVGATQEERDKTKVTKPFDAITLKLNIIKELERETAREVEILQKLGVIYQAPKEIVIDMKAVTLLDQLPPAELERALTLDTEGFMQVLRTNFGEDAMQEIIGSTLLLPAGPTEVPVLTADEQIMESGDASGGIDEAD
jgi:Trp operon repressor